MVTSLYTVDACNVAPAFHVGRDLPTKTHLSFYSALKHYIYTYLLQRLPVDHPTVSQSQACGRAHGVTNAAPPMRKPCHPSVHTKVRVRSPQTTHYHRMEVLCFRGGLAMQVVSFCWAFVVEKAMEAFWGVCTLGT